MKPSPNAKRPTAALFTALLLALKLSTGAAPALAQSQTPTTKSTIPGRILFLGNSITYGGLYVAYVETFIHLHEPQWQGEILNLGLPSETVSGLSEPGHAGGAFPRPDLAERLERVLTKTKPDLVIASYGMNDGIYLPFDETRFQAFQNGILHLRKAAAKVGARIIHLTPPVYDPSSAKTQATPAAHYDEVLGRYAEWLLSKSSEGWTVLDIHGPMSRFLVDQQKLEPGYKLAADGVHPAEIGHWLMARPVIVYFGADKSLQDATSSHPLLGTRPEAPQILKLVTEKQAILKDAWLRETGHKRPGIHPGLPLPEAQKKAAQLDSQIRQILTPNLAPSP